jgi:hypothetical protein
MAGSILENLMSMLGPQVIGLRRRSLESLMTQFNVDCKPERLRCSPGLQRRLDNLDF